MLNVIVNATGAKNSPKNTPLSLIKQLQCKQKKYNHP